MTIMSQAKKVYTIEYAESQEGIRLMLKDDTGYTEAEDNDLTWADACQIAGRWVLSDDGIADYHLKRQ